MLSAKFVILERKLLCIAEKQLSEELDYASTRFMPQLCVLVIDSYINRES